MIRTERRPLIVCLENIYVCAEEGSGGEDFLKREKSLLSGKTGKVRDAFKKKIPNLLTLSEQEGSGCLRSNV